MGVYYLDGQRFTAFVDAVIRAKRVVGPVARHAKFAYEELESAERDRHIRMAIDSLPEKQRMAFILSRYEEMPQKKIAAVMNRTEGAVEQLLQRAKENLKKKLSTP